MLNAYFIKCRNNIVGSEAISIRFFYFKQQALDIIDELNAKNDGYTYFIHQASI